MYLSGYSLSSFKTVVSVTTKLGIQTKYVLAQHFCMLTCMCVCACAATRICLFVFPLTTKSHDRFKSFFKSLSCNNFTILLTSSLSFLCRRKYYSRTGTILTWKLNSTHQADKTFLIWLSNIKSILLSDLVRKTFLNLS